MARLAHEPISIVDLTGSSPADALSIPLHDRDALYGISLVAAEFADSQIRVYGPRGCTSQILEALNNQRQQFDYYHFGMDEREIVFGAAKRVGPKLRKLVEEYEQEGILFLVTTCVPELTGEDVDGFADDLPRNVPVVKLTAGPQGDAASGVECALERLLRRFGQRGPRRERLVNVIGNVGAGREWRADCREVARLLAGAGLRANPIACESRVAHLAAAPTACATVLVSPTVGVAAARFLEQEHGVPVVSPPFGLPLGLRGTERWLRGVAVAAGVEADAIDRLVWEEEARVFLRMRGGLRDEVQSGLVACVQGLRFAVVADAVAALSWTRLLQEELGLRPVLMGSRTELATAPAELREWWAAHRGDAAEVTRPDDRTLRDALERTRPVLVLGSSVERDACEALHVPGFMHICHPNTHYATFTDEPLLGYRGLLRVAETVLNLRV